MEFERDRKFFVDFWMSAGKFPQKDKRDSTCGCTVALVCHGPGPNSFAVLRDQVRTLSP